MGTRTYSRKGVLTAAGRRRAGLEAIDIFGNPIPDRTRTPAQPATAVQPPAQPPAPAPVPAARRQPRTPAVAEPTVSWSPYTKRDVYNPAKLSGTVQEMIKGGGDYVYENRNNSYLRYNMGVLNLDPENRNDCQIYADLVSIFKPENGIISRRGLGRNNSGTGFIVENGYFKTKKDETPDGIGYAMVARQLAAAQEVARRTGKKVTIKVHAVGNNESEATLSGCSVWPKLGYSFPMNKVPYETRVYLRNKGFNVAAMKSTVDLMLSKNSEGQSGFDVWREAIRIASAPDMYGTAVVSPTGKLGRAEQVTREYGKRKGLVKSLSGQPMFDDAVLREVWLSMAKG